MKNLPRSNSVRRSAGLFDLSLKGLVILLIAFAVIGYNTQIHAVQNDKDANKSTDRDIPIYIKSDKMIAQQEAAYTEFIGNVIATRLDTVIQADSIKVYLKTQKESDDAKSSLKQIVATGNVEYTSGSRKAFADKAVYTADDEILVLTGDSPKVKLGTSYVTGKKITFYQKDDQVVVESGTNKRVEALYNPEDGNKLNE